MPRRKNELSRALKSSLQVGLNPDTPRHLKHGTVTFEVSGFGKIQRDFLVNDRELLLQNPKRHALNVAKQIMLLDVSIPKRLAICQPVQIDIRGQDQRRVYELPTFSLVLEETL